MFFKALREECGDLPIIAEDLGVITPDVVALRKDFGLPGMRVLQIAFGGDPLDVHLPHMHTRDSIVYTGTHDNDTTLGWYLSLDSETLQRVNFFLRVTPGSMPEALIRAALCSVGRLAVIPMQDVLGLGSEARLNTPGTAVNNWAWKMPGDALNADLARHFSLLNRAYGRV
jgi:4-alpha-glucanotransferase